MTRSRASERAKRAPSRFSDVVEIDPPPHKRQKPVTSSRSKPLSKPKENLKKPARKMNGPKRASNALKTAAPGINPLQMTTVLINVVKNKEVISISSGESEDIVASDEPLEPLDESRSSTPESKSKALKSITASLVVSQGKIPRLQNSFKTVLLDLTVDYDDFLDFLLVKTKKKLGSKASMVTVGDLAIKYNWWAGREPKAIPSLCDIEDADDFERITTFVPNMLMSGLRDKVAKSRSKIDDMVLLLYVMVSSSVLEDTEGPLNGNPSPSRQVNTLYCNISNC